jgi:2-succinyl-5-enolpyruvyl-6-hydroxy-3-cyclohexene-1-carboxylate synthase
VNPSTAFATALVDELIRCGLQEAVLAPGSRSAPLAMALWQRAGNGGDPQPAAHGGGLRLHVRIDERSAAFLALGLAKAGGRPVALVCTSGTAAAHFHAAVVEAHEAGVPLLVVTADRPPELRGTGANQTIDQLKLYGHAVRWFCEVGVPEARPWMNAYWRSLACRAWLVAAGAAGTFPGPVHLNVCLREPLVPDGPGPAWPEPLAGRAGGRAWTSAAVTAGAGAGAALELPWTERGVIVCGDGCRSPAALTRLAEQAGWPVLAEPSSGARTGPNALGSYQYLLGSPAFVAAHRPDVIVTAGRPGLSRAQLAFLRGAAWPGAAVRHVVIADGPDHWADPARTATDLAPAVRLGGREDLAGGAAVGEAAFGGAAVCEAAVGGAAGRGGVGRGSAWLDSWRRADAAARSAASGILDGGDALSEPRLARDLAAVLQDGALLWAASSLPIRDLDQQMSPRAGLTVQANRGASGIDGLVSAATGAALAHQRCCGGPAVALLGDLAFLHDAPGLFLGPEEPRPDLVLIVVNNNGGGIFSQLEQAAFAGPFERVFGTPHGGALRRLAEAAGIPAVTLDQASGLLSSLRGAGMRVVEVQTSRADGAALRRKLRAACTAAVDASLSSTA